MPTSQHFAQSSLDALSASIAVLDSNGIILTVNASWRNFADENGLIGSDYGIGRSYFESVECLNGDQSREAEPSLQGIRAVMTGQRRRFYMEYPCHSPKAERWFALTVTSFGSSQRQIVVAHENITEQKRDELSLMQGNSSLSRRIDDLSALNQIGQMLCQATTSPGAGCGDEVACGGVGRRSCARRQRQRY